MGRVLDSLHHLPPGNPDRIDFDITTYTGKYAIIGAGTRFGGYVPFVNAAYQVMPEKWTPQGYVPEFWDNIYQGTIFSAIGDIAHEFGHNVGFYHYQGGSYELMHWGGLQKINVNCPPHVNPWQKIVKGWIPNVQIVRRDSFVQLPPIDSSPMVAVISLFGDPGRNSQWGSNTVVGHSEFLIVEYRKRSGFNRFSGGELVPQGFNGGALVWHYSSMTEFPIGGSYVVRRLGMKTVGYGQPPQYQPPNPDHFFPWHGTTLGSSTNPNSNTVANLQTGISLTNIDTVGGYVIFDVNYAEGAQPSYNVFVGPNDGTIPSSWSGNVYCQRSSNTVPINVSSMAPGTIADVFCKIPSSTLSAQGTLSQPITIQGIGNGSYRYQWTGLDLIPSSPTVFPQLQYCNVRNATVGMLLQPLSSTMPLVRNCTLAQNDIDLRVHSANPNVRAELAGLDQNSMSTFQISGYAKLENAAFALAPTTTVRLGQPSYPADIVAIGNSTLTVTSPLAFDFSATMGGSTWVFDVDLTIPQGKALTLQPGSTLLFGESNRLVSYGPLSAIG